MRVPVCGLNATTCAPLTATPFRRTRPAMMPVSIAKARHQDRDRTHRRCRQAEGCGPPPRRGRARSETSPRRFRALAVRHPASSRFPRWPNGRGRGSDRSRAWRPIGDRTGPDLRSKPPTTANIELKKTSDSTMVPVITSTMNVVAPSTRSMSGSLWKPKTDRSSSSNGIAEVKPPNSKAMEAVGTLLPRREGLRDLALKLRRRHTRHAAVVGVPAHARRGPLESAWCRRRYRGRDGCMRPRFPEDPARRRRSQSSSEDDGQSWPRARDRAHETRERSKLQWSPRGIAADDTLGAHVRRSASPSRDRRRHGSRDRHPA